MPKTNPKYTILYKKSPHSGNPDQGTKDDIQKGDVVTFLDGELGCFLTRRASRVMGLLIEMEPMLDEKPHLISKNDVTGVVRIPEIQKIEIVEIEEDEGDEEIEDDDDDFSQIDWATTRFYAV